MADQYIYTSIDSVHAQIRILTINFDIKAAYGRLDPAPICGTLTAHSIPFSRLSRGQRLSRSIKLPAFFALSYVWGDPTPTHEIILDGKKLGITENLHCALRALQRGSIGDVKVWADAICINQSDLAERSAQVFLMREIYHCAANVRIWFGPQTEDGMECMRFIRDLMDIQEYMDDVTLEKTGDVDTTTDAFMSAVLKPTAAIVNAGYKFGQLFISTMDAIQPGAMDSKAEMILDPDGNLSLHQETVDELSQWRPSARSLKKIQDVNLEEIASLIDTTFIQNCAWFERIWVVQELGVAESAAIIYGNGLREWQHFLRAVYYLHYTAGCSVPNIRKLTGLEKIRMGWNERKRQPLVQLIRGCRYRRATDPRDKIYALLGLMGDPMSYFLQPDYTKPIHEVYANVTQHLINQSETLDPICGWQTLGRQELASWIPDYNLNQDLAPSPLLPIDGRKSTFAASGYDHRSKYTLDASCIAEWTILPVTGLFIDSIAMLSDPISDDEPFGSIECIWNSTILAGGKILPGLTKEIEATLETISFVVNKYSDFWSEKTKAHSNQPNSHSYWNDKKSVYTVEEHPLSSSDSAVLSSDLHSTYILDAYLYSLVCCGQISKPRIVKEDIEMFMSMQFPEEGSDVLQDNTIRLICKSFEAGMRGRSMAITNQGYIGALPHQAQPGDLVCVLFGCSVPVVLRKRKEDDSYMFVGECYLHGFMDAEAVVMQVKEELKEQAFILR